MIAHLIKTFWLTVYKLHISWLTYKLGFRTYEVPLFGASVAKWDKIISLPKIRGPLSYIISLHEFGHVYNNLNFSRDDARGVWGQSSGYQMEGYKKEIRILSEMSASEWAIKNALHTTPEMRRLLKTCLETHSYPFGWFERLPR